MLVQQCESEVIEFRDQREELVNNLGQKKEHTTCKPPEP